MDFVKFPELNFLYYNYQYTHGALKRKMHSFALIYIQVCKCRGGVKCLLECELMRGPLP